jgi:hypothetical protein
LHPGRFDITEEFENNCTPRLPREARQIIFSWVSVFPSHAAAVPGHGAADGGAAGAERIGGGEGKPTGGRREGTERCPTNLLK